MRQSSCGKDIAQSACTAGCVFSDGDHPDDLVYEEVLSLTLKNAASKTFYAEKTKFYLQFPTFHATMSQSIFFLKQIYYLLSKSIFRKSMLLITIVFQ